MGDSEDYEDRLTLDKVIGNLASVTNEALIYVRDHLQKFPDNVYKFLHGKKFGWGDFCSDRWSHSKEIGYEDLMERAEQLYAKAQDIWHEKGFRYTGALMTAREHKVVGSSGYGKFEVMPDMVIPIANLTLKISNDMETMSVEEIRIARILAGMPTIDNDGKVTGEVVPVRDSYMFIPDERRVAEIKTLEQEVISGMTEIIATAITRHTSDIDSYRRTIENLADGQATTTEAYLTFEKLKVPSLFTGQLSNVIEDAKKLAYQDGKRDDILTPMELMLLGRSFDEKYKDKPYTPLGVQTGKLMVDDANRIRAGELYFHAESEFFTPYLMPFAFTLEPLTKEGVTERGPVVLDHHEKQPLDERAIAYFKPNVKSVPFARPTDWYFKPVT